NHFTIDLENVDVEEVLEYVERQGHMINSSGGRVKGSRSVLLEQGSTMAELSPRTFADGTFLVPTCFYEFARRYDDEFGRRFDGFIETNADKIFESTDVRV